ncbi:hypothetical protein M0811_09876 [Anaeramoeba ignava]|uniref:Uncharacterized protein n=1 Tax=Anaeramoeba ignava TaxID=1746090 RepID=A0A9Q0LEV7_ANAIG|nr:hypothetical protein M0811_09876 [Anaeramoeba ignava]
MNEIIFFGRNQYPILFKNEPNEITKPIQFKFENENENKNENKKQIKQISSSYFGTFFLFKNGKAIEYSKQNPEKIQIENIQKVSVGSDNEAILTKEGSNNSRYCFWSSCNLLINFKSKCLWNWFKLFWSTWF